jgi:penicillin-insensitive murein endopeptidase
MGGGSKGSGQAATSTPPHLGKGVGDEPSARRRRWRGPLAAVVAVGAAAILARGSSAMSLASAGTVVEVPAASAKSQPPRHQAHQGHAGAPTSERRPFPFLAGESRDAPISVGDTSHGYLVAGAELVEDDTIGILPEQKKRDLRWGTGGLVKLLRDAAALLHKETGTRMWVGNIGKREGGDIAWSVSHNSGRDADVAFCYTDHKGKPVDPPDLVPLNGEGLAKNQNLRLDAKRTWLIIKGLLLSDAVEVQYLFLANALKTQVLTYAAQHGEPFDLIQRAGVVIRQPAGSAPHNDHLHVRVFCSERDVLGGCENNGAVHPWTKLYQRERERFVAKVATVLDDADARERASAVERLALLDARDEAERIAGMLDDERVVREATARALGRLGGPAEAKRLAAHFAREADGEVRVAVVQSIGALGGKDAGAFLVRAVGKPLKAATWPLAQARAALLVGGPTLLPLLPDAADALEERILGELGLGPAIDPEDLTVQLVAIEAAAQAERLEPAMALVALLEDSRPLVRERAGHALSNITNLSYHVDWENGDAAARQLGHKRWRDALTKAKGAPREAWLVTGFRGAGYHVRELHPKHSWELVRAIAGADHLSFNAQRVLMRLHKHRAPTLAWSKAAACNYWLKFVRSRREDMGIERPPAKVIQACGGAR